MNDKQREWLALLAAILVAFVLVFLMSGCAVTPAPATEDDVRPRAPSTFVVICIFASCRNIGVPDEPTDYVGP